VSFGAIPARFTRAVAAARRRRLGRAGVVGVAWGFKWKGGVRTDVLAVHFLVERKLRRPAKALPRSILGIPTDVIEVGRPAFACRAGSPVRAGGERGTIALAFRPFLLTCAHVAGDLERSPPIDPVLRDRRRRPIATVIKNTVGRRGVVEYDLAVAEVLDGVRIANLGIAGGGRLREWLDPGDLEPGMTLRVAAASGRRQGEVVSLAAEVLVRLDGTLYRVRNLASLRLDVEEGDSGGLVHAGRRAAGIVVARSPGGLAWWQPLRPALEHLDLCSPRTCLRPFRDQQGRGS
jgi:hypothetical protein